MMDRDARWQRQTAANSDTVLDAQHGQGGAGHDRAGTAAVRAADSPAFADGVLRRGNPELSQVRTSSASSWTVDIKTFADGEIYVKYGESIRAPTSSSSSPLAGR